MPTAKPRNDNSFRTIREEKSFEDSVRQLGGSELVDEALSVICEALSCRPEGFDLIPGFEPIRIAKTDRVARPKGNIPALRVWFVISDDTTVSLLYAEEIPQEL